MFKKLLERFLRHVYIFNSQESHWCHPNCLRLVRAFTLPKLRNGPGPYDPGAKFRGKHSQSNVSQLKKSRERAVLAETGKVLVRGVVAIPPVIFFPGCYDVELIQLSEICM